MTDGRTPSDRRLQETEGEMTTKLEGPLKRALTLGGDPYVLTVTPEGLTLVPKGKRKGYSLAWDAFISGEAALATALNASLMATAPNSGTSKPAPSAVASGKRPPAKRSPNR